jgi:predicted NAD/FAD-dependent oxidoreductase
MEKSSSKAFNVALKAKVIILGAGMSGIACGLTLNSNFKVSIFEKSRGVGGRLCAKKTTNGLLHLGAQFCTAQSDQFREFLAKNNAINFMGSAYECDKKLTIKTKNYFVHEQGMHGLLKKAAKSLNICFNQKAIHIDEREKIIYFESGHKETYDIIISSLPLPQSQDIFQSTIEHDSKFGPCIAVGMNFKLPSDIIHNAFKNFNADVPWFASSKFYNSEEQETWIMQFSPEASTKMMSASDSYIENAVTRSIADFFNQDFKLKNIKIFRWKYALCSRSELHNKFTSISEEAFAIGDWNISARVESAYISGVALGNFLNEARA